jgi:hypothetical protein
MWISGRQPFINFKLHAILKSGIKSYTVSSVVLRMWLILSSNISTLYVYFPVNHLLAILVIRWAVLLPQCCVQRTLHNPKPNVTSPCLCHSPYFFFPHRPWPLPHLHSVKYRTMSYFVREHIYLTFITVHCYHFSVLLLLLISYWSK